MFPFSSFHGITPACAGNRQRLPSSTTSSTDHPRVCGEQHAELFGVTVIIGSPPRVRGTVPNLATQYGGNRITPACAGNRMTKRYIYGEGGDHPRVCGEQYPCWHFGRPHHGSPPRVRGTVFPTILAGNAHRITPACAGNRPPPFAAAWCTGDHPRVCGEQALGRSVPDHQKGSPPRVRGTD